MDMRIRWRDERGVAVVTALLISIVLAGMAVTAVTLSIHNSSLSAYDRKRVQAIDAAEAGVNATYQKIATSPTASLPCTVDADLPTAPTAHYHVTVAYYATYPPTGTALSCPPPAEPNPPPLGVQVVSKGTAVQVGSPTAVSRTMESVARMTALFGPFGQAIFADSQLNLQNNLDVYGNVGNDGDVYINGGWTCNNSSYIRGSVLAQGSANVSNSCTVASDLYAKDNITMTQSATVNHDAIAAGGSISMANNTHVYNNATAATTCTGCTTGAGGRVAGSVIPNHVSAPPAYRPFPIVNYDQTAWQNAGYTIVTYADCNTAKAAIIAGFAAKTVVRITPACTMSFSNNTTVNIKNDLAIITDGALTTVNQNNWQGVGGNYTLYVIVPYDSAATCPVGTHDITISNNTDFSSVKLLLYTRCTLDMSNHNVGQGGQLFGGTVNIKNLYNLTFKPILIPGAGQVTGYALDIAYLREVTNK